MNHEYVLFSKNTCQNSMVNVLDKDKILWYVMRAYKNENTAEDRLSNETYGLEYFIPKQKVLRTVKGKKVFFMVPVIHSLVFVHASHQKIVDFKHNYYYDLQFVTWKSGGELVYLTVPTSSRCASRQMKRYTSTKSAKSTRKKIKSTLKKVKE